MEPPLIELGTAPVAVAELLTGTEARPAIVEAVILSPVVEPAVVAAAIFGAAVVWTAIVEPPVVTAAIVEVAIVRAATVITLELGLGRLGRGPGLGRLSCLRRTAAFLTIAAPVSRTAILVSLRPVAATLTAFAAALGRLGQRRAGEQSGDKRRRQDAFHDQTPFHERTPKDAHRTYSLLTLLSALADEPCLNRAVGNSP